MLAWMRKHKRKLALLAVAAAGGYLGGRWLLRKAGELQEKRQSSEQESRRLQRHYKNNRHLCLDAVLGLLGSLQEAVKTQLNAESITAKLRAKPADKVTLWENLKIISFARLVVGAYMCSALTVLLRVQLSVFGGTLFLRQQGPDQTGDCTAEVQRQCVVAVQHLMGDGLVRLVQAVRGAAEHVLVSYSLKHQLARDGLWQLLADIRTISSTSGHPPGQGADGRPASSFLLQYMMPRESLLEGGGEGTQLTAATRDIVESAEFCAVLEGAVEQAFSLLTSHLSHTFHSAAQSSSSLPVARIIPLIVDLCDVTFAPGPKGLVQQLFSNSELQRLSECVFEAFSNP